MDDRKLQLIKARVPADVADAIRAHAEARRLPLAVILRQALAEKIDRETTAGVLDERAELAAQAIRNAASELHQVALEVIDELAQAAARADQRINLLLDAMQAPASAPTPAAPSAPASTPASRPLPPGAAPR